MLVACVDTLPFCVCVIQNATGAVAPHPVGNLLEVLILKFTASPFAL